MVEPDGDEIDLGNPTPAARAVLLRMLTACRGISGGLIRRHELIERVNEIDDLDLAREVIAHLASALTTFSSNTADARLERKHATHDSQGHYVVPYDDDMRMWRQQVELFRVFENRWGTTFGPPDGSA